jgi:hypothetical protein
VLIWFQLTVLGHLDRWQVLWTLFEFPFASQRSDTRYGTQLYEATAFYPLSAIFRARFHEATFTGKLAETVFDFNRVSDLLAYYSSFVSAPLGSLLLMLCIAARFAFLRVRMKPLQVSLKTFRPRLVCRLLRVGGALDCYWCCTPGGMYFDFW